MKDQDNSFFLSINSDHGKSFLLDLCQLNHFSANVGNPQVTRNNKRCVYNYGYSITSYIMSTLFVIIILVTQNTLRNEITALCGLKFERSEVTNIVFELCYIKTIERPDVCLV